MNPDLFKSLCPQCYTDNSIMHTTYTIQSGQTRRILHCRACGNYFSETSGTHLADLRIPLSRIQQILTAVHEGLGINARTLHLFIRRCVLFIGPSTQDAG
jgi:transposase-like protein